MNSISYLAHRAEGVLRPRKKTQDEFSLTNKDDINVDLEDEEEEEERFNPVIDKESDVFEEDDNDNDKNEDYDDERLSVFSIEYIIRIIMFIPNLVIIKPIQYIWFIVTFPLYLLEKKPQVDDNINDLNLEISDDEEIKEPYDEFSQKKTNVDNSQSLLTVNTSSRKLSNTTIFETEEEEEEEGKLIIDKSNNDLKSPTSSSIFLSPSTTNKDEIKSVSKSYNPGRLNSTTTQRSFLSFPKTVYPMSLINSSNKKTLILDLDETLIHSISRGTRVSVGSGHMIEVRFQNEVPTLYYVYKRPYCDLFLKQVSKWFNLVIFTASVKEYADPVIDWLEIEKNFFKKRFYRNNCTLRKGQGYIKDLSTVDKNLNNLIIVDNSPISYAMHENNAIVVEGWINDPTDTDLLNLIPLLSSLRYTTDVRAVLALKNGEAAFEK